jgi:hypothetical protein
MGSDVGFDNDVNNDGFDSVEITVNDVSEVEATTNNLEFRQWVRIVNKGPGRLLVGPLGKPKEELRKGQGIVYNHGPDNQVYMIAESGSSVIALVVESG